MTFIEDKKWESLEQINSWKKPDSVPMSILSWFFRLSHFLKVMKIRFTVSFILLRYDFDGYLTFDGDFVSKALKLRKLQCAMKS